MSIINEGYRAQARGQSLKDNPYPKDTNEHWEWRKGFLEAFQDSH